MASENTLDNQTPSSVTLARHMTLFTLIVYGVGDMVGTGIYATIGKAAGAMGNAVWAAFLASMVAALLTGLSYASISSRYPRAAGAAYVAHRAFHKAFLSYFVGLAVTASGLTSMASGSNAFANAMHEAFLPGLNVKIIIVAYLVAITFLNFWGIRESMWGNLLCTLVEVGGIVFVIVVGMRFWGGIDYFETPYAVTNAAGNVYDSGLSASLILAGGVLTFYSFVGFEDMLNVAEEVKNPTVTMPWGIVIALAITTVLYILVAITAVSVIHYKDLAAAGAPFELITQKAAPWLPDRTFSIITLFAVANTGLINYIMSSRLVYGMARQGFLPRPLGAVHPKRRTPHIAIFVLFALVVVLALSGGVGDLASATSLLLLGCFIIVNLSLVVLKLRAGEPRGSFEIPVLVPILGILVCGALIYSRLTARDPAGNLVWKAPAIAAALGVGIGILYLVMRPKNITEETLAVAEGDPDR